MTSRPLKTTSARSGTRRYIKWAFLGVFASLGACQVTPLDGFTLTFKEPLADGLYTFTLRNYANQPLSSPALVLGGVDRSKLVNHLNDPVFRPTEDGRFLVGLERSLQPSSEAPVQFSTTFEQTGYVPYTQGFRAVNRANRSFIVRLAPLDREENGVRGSVGTWRPGQEARVGQTVWQVPVGVAWQGATGQALSGEVQVRLLQFNATARGYLPSTTISRLFLPDGTSSPDAYQLSQLAGFFQVQAYQGDTEVMRWEGPLSVRYPVASQTNPITGQPLKVGDRIPGYEYNPQTGRWTYLGELEVRAKSDGSMEVTVSVSVAGTYVLGWFTAVCSTAARIRIQSNLTDLDIAHYGEFRRVSDNRVLRSFHLSMNQGSTTTSSFFPRDTGPIQYVLFASTDYHGGDRTKPIYVSPPFDPCDPKEILVDVRTILTKPPSVSATFLTDCPAGTTLQENLIPAQIRIQFSAPGTNQWRDLGSFSRTVRKVVSYRLLAGRTYDFRVSTDGGVTWPVRQLNFRVSSNYVVSLASEGYCK